MTDFLHPVPSSSKGPPQWRPMFKRAPTTVQQTPVMAPKTKAEELTMALQRPWLKFDMARKPSDQSQNDYVPEIFVACKLVPSFDDFFKECSAELEYILKKRPTVSPKIKINVGNRNEGETITLYNSKGEAHTTTVQSGSTLTTLGQLDSDKTLDMNVTGSTTATRKFNSRSKRKVRNVPRILANSKRRFNDLPKNLRMLYRRYKIKDCFVFMYKVPYTDNFALTSPESYKASTLTENQYNAERLNEEGQSNKLEQDNSRPDDKTDGNKTPGLENGNGTTTDDIEPTLKQPEERCNLRQPEENSNLQLPEEKNNLEQSDKEGCQASTNSICTVNTKESLSMPELELGSPRKEVTMTRKTPPRINSQSPALNITPTLAETDSIRPSKNGSHSESIKHTLDYLINQNSKESPPSSYIDGNRSESPEKLLSSASIQIFRKSQDKESTLRRDKNSPSPKLLEQNSVQYSRVAARGDENSSPNSEVSLTRSKVAASDTKSCSPKPVSSSTPHSISKEVRQPLENRFPHEEIKANQILRRHSLGEEDRIRTGNPSRNGHQGSTKRVRSKSKEDGRQWTENCRVRTSGGPPLTSESNIQNKRTTYPTEEHGVVATQPSASKNCDKPYSERGRTTWPVPPSTGVPPVVIKEEPKDDSDPTEPPTKKPKCDEDIYLRWMARRVKKEHAKTDMELKTVTFKIYSCFRCHKEFSEHKHWAKHICVPESN